MRSAKESFLLFGLNVTSAHLEDLTHFVVEDFVVLANLVLSVLLQLLLPRVQIENSLQSLLIFVCQLLIGNGTLFLGGCNPA